MSLYFGCFIYLILSVLHFVASLSAKKYDKGMLSWLKVAPILKPGFCYHIFTDSCVHIK